MVVVTSHIGTDTYISLKKKGYVTSFVPESTCVYMAASRRWMNSSYLGIPFPAGQGSPLLLSPCRLFQQQFIPACVLKLMTSRRVLVSFTRWWRSSIPLPNPTPTSRPSLKGTRWNLPPSGVAASPSSGSRSAGVRGGDGGPMGGRIDEGCPRCTHDDGPHAWIDAYGPLSSLSLPPSDEFHDPGSAFGQEEEDEDHDGDRERGTRTMEG